MAAVLADGGRQVFIGRLELVPPRVGVAALTPGEVGGEIFDMDLDPRPVGGELVQGHAPFLPDQDGLVTVGGAPVADGETTVAARYFMRYPLTTSSQTSAVALPRMARRSQQPGAVKT